MKNYKPSNMPTVNKRDIRNDENKSKKNAPPHSNKINKIQNKRSLKNDNLKSLTLPPLNKTNITNNQPCEPQHTTTITPSHPQYNSKQNLKIT